MSSQNLFNQGRVPDNNGTGNVLGHGEYIVWEFGGPEYQYLAVRDTLRANWLVSYNRVNERGNIEIIYVGQTPNLADAEQMAMEDAGDLQYDRRLREHDEAQDAKERDDPRYASQWDEYMRDGGPNNPDLH